MQVMLRTGVLGNSFLSFRIFYKIGMHIKLILSIFALHFNFEISALRLVINCIPTLVALVFSICISYFGKIHYDKYGIGYLGAIHLAIFAAGC